MADRYIKDSEETLRGEGKEIEFAKDFQYQEKVVCEKSNKNDNIYKHTDLYFYYPDNEKNKWSIDVKALKRSQRYSALNDKYHWIEYQNVKGNTGWIDGDEDYLAFETNNDWLLVRRKRLKDALDKTITNPVILHYNTQDDNMLYRKYQRKDRQDIIVKVETQYIRNLIVFNGYGKIIEKISKQ